MLKQLLARQGMGMRIAEKLPDAAKSRADTREVALVCLSYLSVDAGAAHASVLIRRLRRRIPGAKILLGFLAHDQSAEESNDRDALKAGSGADLIATSLEEAVAICIREAGAAPGGLNAVRADQIRPEVA
jgi:hypothetical protein